MATTNTELPASGYRIGAHYATMLLGAWLVISGLIWHPDSGAAAGSLDWILGLGTIALSVATLRQPRFHWAIVAVGALLLILSVAVPHGQAYTAWSERVVGVLLVLLGLVGGGQLPAHDE
jgi:hypothetical protein